MPKDPQLKAEASHAPQKYQVDSAKTFLVNLTQTMGIEGKRVIADEGCHDKNGSLFAHAGTIVTILPSSKVFPPENVEGISRVVCCNFLSPDRNKTLNTVENSFAAFSL